jgi:hypothetical protein
LIEIVALLPMSTEGRCENEFVVEGFSDRNDLVITLSSSKFVVYLDDDTIYV